MTSTFLRMAVGIGIDIGELLLHNRRVCLVSILRRQANDNAEMGGKDSQSAPPDKRKTDYDTTGAVRLRLRLPFFSSTNFQLKRRGQTSVKISSTSRLKFRSGG